MKKHILIILSVLTFSLSRSAAQGINFQPGLTWTEVLKKAKTGHKYIFVDCYATWCGPCKAMDASVYSQKSVGDVYNSQFVCIKLQMDKTNQDNADVKKQRSSADFVSKSYAVKAFPTFIFFDEDGHPLHKEVGYQTPKQFVRLAADVSNPAKQYYNILKHFRPGKLDTAEERALAISLDYGDTTLKYKLGEDYIARTPPSKRNTAGIYELMLNLQNDPKVYQAIVEQVTRLTVGPINETALEFIDDPSIKDRPEIQKLTIAYLKKLNDPQLSRPENMNLMIYDKTDGKKQNKTAIANIAKGYINRLPEDSLYTKKNLRLISIFTDLPTDRAFKLFYDNGRTVDAVMETKGYAEGVVKAAIIRAELDPLLIAAKQTGIPPDFEATHLLISKKYNSYYATRIVTSGRANWFIFLVYDKKQAQYWPQLTSARIAYIELNRPDTVKGALTFTNNVCYDEIFKHCDARLELEKAAGFMKNQIALNPQTAVIMDTYAVLLYKAGKTNQGIEEEKKALEQALRTKNQRYADAFSYTIEQMQQGAKIWEDKKIIGN